MSRDDKYPLTDEELEIGSWGESLEAAVVEIRNMLPFLETAFSGVEFAAVAIRAKELGFDRQSAFWPIVFEKQTTYGMAWKDEPELVAGIEPPPELSAGWKLDPFFSNIPSADRWHRERRLRDPRRADVAVLKWHAEVETTSWRPSHRPQAGLRTSRSGETSARHNR